MSRKPSSIASKAEAALKKAVHKVVKEHERTGEPLIVWKNGKVARISASLALRGHA
jgi:hypothetical protein